MSPPVQALERRLPAHMRIEGDCCTWTGFKTNGYGLVAIRGRQYRVHRIAYELWVGEIPEGLHIDHLCRNRACFNPDHLEAVTQAENNRRAGAVKRTRPCCGRGHPYLPNNTILDTRGYRRCRTCVLAAKARYRAKARVQSQDEAAS